jgi:hypothetical protein
MALNATTLATALEKIFDGTADTTPTDGNPDGVPTSSNDAGAKIAKAYTNYAGAAMFAASTVNVSSKESALATTLGAALVAPGAPATAAAAFGAGLTTFWTGAPVAGAQSGVTVPPTGAAALVAALTTLFGNAANTAAAAASGLAAALDTCTKTVTAAVAPPPGTVLVIS